MDNHCYVGITIGGEVGPRRLKRLIEGLAVDFLHDEYDYEKDFFMAYVNNKPVFYEEQDVNYGGIDDAEYACWNAKVTYFVDQSAGSEYSAQKRLWRPGMKATVTVNCGNNDGSLIELSTLRHLLGKPDALNAISKLVEEASLADVRNVPPVTLTPALYKRLAKRYAPEIAAKALQLEPATGA